MINLFWEKEIILVKWNMSILCPVFKKEISWTQKTIEESPNWIHAIRNYQ